MDWTVGRRIGIGFTGILCLVALIAALGIWALHGSSSRYRSTINKTQTTLVEAMDARFAKEEANVRFLRLLLEGDAGTTVGVDSALDSARSLIVTLRDQAVLAPQRAAWVEVLTHIEGYRSAVDSSIEAGRKGDLEEAHRLRRDAVMPARALLDGALTRAVNGEVAEDQQAVADTEAASRRIRLLLAGGALLTLILGGLAAWFITRKVTAPLAEMGEVLASSVAEITAAATQQASSAQESMAAVSETASTVDEATQTANQAEERARSVAESAKNAARVSDEGKAAVENSIAAMRTAREQVQSLGESVMALAERAQAVGEIIETVTELADQTNVLALNASIEAARAGEQGRGFSVVAAEVRSLAEESKRATVRVRGILEEIQRATGQAVMAAEQGTKHVNSGTERVTEAGETIRSLADAIDQAAQAAVQISASSGQQKAGMTQIRQAISDIEAAAQQNVAGTQQTKTAAESVKAAGAKLLVLVGAKGASSMLRR